LSADTGGCGGCAQQIAALQAPRYAAELRGQGISLARSPRHADVILITGALTEVARAPIRQLLDGVPQPRALVAVGNCAIDGCVFHGSPVLSDSAAEALDVNVEIAGCPPSPRQIMDAIREAAQLLRSEGDWAEGPEVMEDEGGDEAASTDDADADDDRDDAEADDDLPDATGPDAPDAQVAEARDTGGRGGQR
jgi:Ni,Fe-hydrogenase III small subunit